MRYIISGVLIFILSLPSFALAQSGHNDWSAVTAVRAGTRIQVQVKSGKKTDGTVDRVAETEIVLAGNTTIHRDDIRKVSVVGERPVAKSVALGAGIGALGGLALGAAGGGCSPNSWCFFSRKDTALIGSILGVALGSATGLIAGLIRHKRTLIYQVR